MTYNKIESCPELEQGRCPYQKDMERVYLIPQLIPLDELQQWEKICLACAKSQDDKGSDLRATPSTGHSSLPA